MSRTLYLSFLITLLIVTYALSKTEKQRYQSAALIGTWQYCNPEQYSALKKQKIREKIITKNNFSVFDIDYKKRHIISGAKGKYSVNNNVYIENINTTTNDSVNQIDSELSYTFKIVNNLLYLEGINNNCTEIWEKVNSQK